MPRNVNQIRNEYYDLFQAKPLKKSEAKKLKKDELYNLFLKPKKDNPPTQYNDSIPNTVQQADLLYMPEDENYKYVLVVVDVATKITDAIPIKTKDALAVKRAFEAVYKRGILKEPKFMMELDDGAEFKGVVKKYFKDDVHVIVKYAKAGRSRQLNFVENRNRLISTALFKRMTAQQLISGQISTEWVQDLPKIISAMNSYYKTQKPKKPISANNVQILLPKGKEVVHILPIGTKVRVVLDKPMETIGNRLHGKFRSTDIRWDPVVHEITNVILSPAEPVMYSVDGYEHTAFTRNNLQVVSKDEVYPPHEKVLRSDNGTYMIDKIVGKRRVGNVIEYRIKWKGYASTDNTWEKQKNLLSNKKNKNIIDRYNQDNS